MYLCFSKLIFEVLRLTDFNCCRLVVSLTSLGPLSGVHLRMWEPFPEKWPQSLYGSLNCNVVEGKTSNNKTIPSVILKMLEIFKRNMKNSVLIRKKNPNKPTKPHAPGNYIKTTVKLNWQREGKGCSQSTVCLPSSNGKVSSVAGLYLRLCVVI